MLKERRRRMTDIKPNVLNDSEKVLFEELKDAKENINESDLQ